MIDERLIARTQELAAARQAFVVATVVHAQRPTSAGPGDVALVLADGTMEGFVGGVCAEETVRLQALRAMETGEPLLLRLLPDEGEEELVEGAVTAHNPCLSGGALEIFLDPSLPTPRVVVMGDAPVAQALRRLAPEVGLEPAGERSGDDLAVVVATHGRGEDQALAAALEDGVAYVGLVASRRRGEAVRAGLAVDDALRSRLHTPAGLPIGARTPAEIALAILAEIIQERRSGAPHGAPAGLPTAAELAARAPHGAPAAVSPAIAVVQSSPRGTPDAAPPSSGGSCCHGGG